MATKPVRSIGDVPGLTDALTTKATTISLSRLNRCNKVAFFGHSIVRGYTNLSDNIPATPFPTIVGWKMAYTGRPIEVTNLGVDGDTLALMLARVQQVIDSGAGVCVILGATNSIAQSVSLSSMTTDATAITTTLLNAGVRPVWCTELPRADMDATRNATLRAWNRWLAITHCPAYGLQLIDTYTACVNADGTPNSNISADQRHPTANGYSNIATKVAASLATTYSGILANEAPSVFAGEANVQEANFAADGNADGIADFWSMAAAGGATIAGALSTHPTAGKWQQMTYASGGTGRYASMLNINWQSLASLNMTPGGGYAFEFDLDTDAMTAACYYKARVQFYDGAATQDHTPLPATYPTITAARLRFTGTVPTAVAGGTTPTHARIVFGIHTSASSANGAVLRIGRVLLTGKPV